jgi:hypothetical protein
MDRDRWDGEYGTNFAIPGFGRWVRDMQVPWWVAELRNSYPAGGLHQTGAVPHKTHPVQFTPEPIHPLGMGMNGCDEFKDMVELLVHGR